MQFFMDFLATFVTSLVLDKIMYGMGAGTLIIVITVKGKPLQKEYLK